jgi:hypothetical protein
MVGGGEGGEGKSPRQTQREGYRGVHVGSGDLNVLENNAASWLLCTPSYCALTVP